jgi:hypothetical protein
MSWNKRIAAAAAISLLVSSLAYAEGIDTPVHQDFPGWKVFQQVAGELNGDGNPDVAAILSKPAEGTDENGQALLVVYVGDGHGGYKLAVQAPKAICVGCGGPKAAMGEPLGELSISRGQLRVTYQGGSREAFDDELKWRFDKQANDFQLIGETYHVTDTVGNEPEETLDINYTTLKMEKKVGRKKHGCAVDPQFHTEKLSSFDYDEKHVDDLDKISEGCGKH